MTIIRAMAAGRRPTGAVGVGAGTGPTAARSAALALAALVAGGCGGGGGGGGGGDGTTLIDPPAVLPEARGLLPSLALADHNFESDHHSGSENCGACHNNEAMKISTDAGPRDVSIGTAWETSTMANATRDPYWHAVVAYELDRFPMHEDTINDKCTVCHAPMANDYAKKEGLTLRVFDKGEEGDDDFEPGLYGMSADDALFNHGMDGVSCTLCHQIDPDNLGIDSTMPASSQSGGYEIVDYSDGDIADRPAYGQYADPDAGYMRQQVGFLAQEGAHLSRSETCATCHNLDIESLHEDGEPVEGVPHFSEQANYTEWLFSDYAVGGPLEASCQDCHMPVLEQAVVIAEGSGLPKREGFAEHTFLGANTVMQSMLRDFAAELGVQPGLDFDASIARNRAFLETSATLSLENARLESAADGTTLAFDVEVVNETGHKLPTGYHSRRVWLHVQVTDEAGELVFESGRMNPDGSIVGVAEDRNPSDWERHHDLITSERDVQVYQAIVGDAEGERTHSLLTPTSYLKDNRLVPKGFDKASVTGSPAVLPTFGTFGGAMDDDDFDSGRDTVGYRVAVPEGGSYSVRATLRYQPISHGHLAELFRTSDRIDQVDMFRTMYERTELKAETIASATATVD